LAIQPKSDINFVRLLQSNYLRDEQRYDKWGVLGKVLLLQETLHRQQIKPVSGPALERLINKAFPRTFSCPQNIQPVFHSESMKKYYSDLRHNLVHEGMESAQATVIAREETAEKFCTTLTNVEAILR
jgi:hypothetical protein